MRKHRNRIALLLVLAMALTLIGCETAHSNPTEGSIVAVPTTTTEDDSILSTPATSEGANDSTSEPTEPEPIVSVQYLPEEVENPQNLPVLKWVCMVEKLYGGGNRVWNETAVRELNQMLADKGLPFRIQFAMVTMDQWLPYSDWFSRPEAQAVLADADLIYGVMSAKQMQEYLTPITEYVNGDAQPSLSGAVPHESNWYATTVDGEIYGVCSRPPKALSKGWLVDSAFMEKHKLTEAAFAHNFWEMDDIFAELYKENENKPFLYIDVDSVMTVSNTVIGEMDSLAPGSISSIIPNYYQQIGACFAIDFSENEPKIVNTLETDVVRNIQQAAKRYIEAGYVTKSTQTAHASTLAQIKYDHTIGLEAYKNWNGDLCVPVTMSICETTSRWGYISGIASTSEHKTEAAEFLNLIAEDESFRKQLFYGKEERDYKVVDGYYKMITQADGSDYSLSMISPLSFFCGLTADWETAGLTSPGTQNWDWIEREDKTKLQTYQENMDECVARYLPITFDYSKYEEELLALESIFGNYFGQFTSLTENEYDKMLQEIKDAGGDQILSELQRQLEVWNSESHA